MRLNNLGKLGAISALTLALTTSGLFTFNKVIANKAWENSISDTKPSKNGFVNLATSQSHIDTANSSHYLTVLIPLALQHQHKLDKLILEQSDPSSRHFQKYLSVKKFDSEFTPTAKHYMTLVNFLTSHGINISAVSPNHLFIEITASKFQFESVFGKPQVNGGKPGVKNSFEAVTDYSVPDSLKNIVENITLLSNQPTRESSNTNSYTPPSGWPSGYSPQQIDTVYNFPNNNNFNVSGKTFSGRGTTIAIASISGTYDPQDVTAFWNHYGIARTGKINNVVIGKPSKTLSFETTLDIEQAGASAPGANILVYEARHSYLKNAALMLNRIVTDDKADIINCSWGVSENLTPPNIIAITHEILKEAAVQGIAVFAASGDFGAYDDPNSSKPNVNYPASDPYATAVGGTTLVITGNGTRDLESAWFGSGGGVSKIFSKPTWQNIPGMPKNSWRDTPDVSLDADSNTGYATLFKNQWIEGGGTSYATPNWSAGWALAIEEAGHRIAMPAIYIYDIANSPVYSSIFYDVKTGENGDHIGPGYRAGVGYDYPTGWGTPNMSLLATWLANYKLASTHTNIATTKLGHNRTSVPVHTTFNHLPKVNSNPEHASFSLILPKPKQLCVRKLAVRTLVERTTANKHNNRAKAGPIWNRQAPVRINPVNRAPAANKPTHGQAKSGGHRELRAGPIWTTSTPLWTYSGPVKHKPNS